MNATRRCFLKFCGGAAAGALVSPLPWKLLDDVSIWTQNWSWTARPPRGPVGAAFTTCTLCPTGCGMRLRTIGEHIVSAWGVEGHPQGAAALCPLGTGFAQLRHHPLRLGSAVRRDDAGDWVAADADAIVAEAGHLARSLADAGRGDRIAVLDPRPGRALSALYGEFCSALGARYVTLPDNRELSEAALAGWLDLGPLRPGLDPARAGAVISFGSPVFDDWRESESASGLPGSGHDSGRAPLRVQIEPNLSRTATRADVWLPIRPGTEAAVGLGLAHLLRGRAGEASSRLEQYGEAGRRFVALADQHTPQYVSRRTGLDPALLAETARRILDHAPAVFVGGGNPGAGPLGVAEEFAIWGLNLMLGGPVLRLRPSTASLFGETATQATALADVPDGSLDLLLIDGAFPTSIVPPSLLRRKLDPGGRIVGLSAFGGGLGAHCDCLLPTAAPGEYLDDVPAPALAPRATWAVADALPGAVAEAPRSARHPAERLEQIAAAAGIPGSERLGRDGHAERLQARAERLIERGGHLFDPRKGSTKAVSLLTSPGSLLKALRRGGCWIADEAEVATPSPARGLDEALTAALDRIGSGRTPAIRTDERFEWTRVVEAPAALAISAPLPPVVSKLYRESNLLAGAGVVRVNPESARRAGLPDGCRVRLLTPRGEAVMRTVHDGSVMPDVVVVAPGPSAADLGDPARTENDILELCDAATATVWRVGRASLRRV